MMDVLGRVHMYVGIFKNMFVFFSPGILLKRKKKIYSLYFKMISSTSSHLIRLSGGVKHTPKPEGGEIIAKHKHTSAN